jgi:CheY-like chemotaxis protein
VRRGAVLVVEDDEDIRESIRLILEEEGYRVLDAPDGVAGLAILQQSLSALVVLVDFRMPRMDGIAMLREVAKHQPLARQHVYVLVTANYDQLPPGCADLIASLAVRTVKKPFDVDVLLSAVAKACDALPAGHGSGLAGPSSSASGGSAGSCRAQ